MRTLSLLAAAMAVVAATLPVPDEPGPHPYVRASRSGAYYIKVVPDREGAGTCTAYQATAASTDPELWSISGWWSFGTLLSDDGQYLVRYGDAQKADEALVVFYKAGTLVAQHTVRELLEDPRPPTDPECAFSFLSGPPQFVGTTSFRLVTVEGVECTFDYRTGKLVSKLRP